MKEESRVPEPTSNRERLMRLVERNGGKFEFIQKIIKKLRFIQIEIFFSQKLFR